MNRQSFCPRSTVLPATAAPQVSQGGRRGSQLLGLVTLWSLPAFAAVIPVEPLPKDKTASFESDVFPFLSDNCVSCHSKSTHKGGLNLETPEAILKGGDSGPSVVPGKPLDSLLMKACIHEDPDSAMPPRDNKVKAKNLTPLQIGALQRWIELGAKAGRARVQELKWRPLPSQLKSILAVASSADGELAACSRGSEISVYQTATSALLFRAQAHQDQVQALAFSPDGRTLVSGGFREIKVWQREQARPARGVQQPAGLHALSPDGRWIALVDASSLKVRELGKPDAPLQETGLQGAFTRIVWNADASAIAVLGEQKRLTVWSRTEARILCATDLPLEGKALAWSAEGKALYTAGGDAVLREWDARSGASLGERKGLPAETVSIEAHDSKLAVGCADGTVWIWEGNQPDAAVKIKAPGAALFVGFSADAARLAVAGPDATVRVFDRAGKILGSFKGDPGAQKEQEDRKRALEMEEGTLSYRKELLAEAEKALVSAKDRLKKTADSIPVKAKEVEAKQKSVVDSGAPVDAVKKAAAEAEAAFVAAETAFKAAQATATSSAEKAAKAKADAATPPEVLADTERERAGAAKALEGATTAQKVKETARKTAVDALDAAEKKKMAAAMDLEKAERAKLLAESELALSKTEEKESTEAVAKAKTAATAQEESKVKAAALLEKARKLADTAPAVSSLKLVGSQGALLVGLANGVVQVRSLESGGLVGWFGEPREKGAVHALAATAGSGVLAISEDGVAWGWNRSEKWVLKKTLGDGSSADMLRDRVTALSFSADGSVFAAGSGEPSREGDVLLWRTAALDAPPRKAVGIHSDTILSLSFSPDGKTLLSGGADKAARVIDVEKLSVVRSLEGHTHHVLGVSWSPDGRSVVTGGGDNVVKVWDVATGARKKNVDGVDKEVTSVQFLGAGTQFAAASGDGKVRVVGTNGTVVRTMIENASFVNSLAAPRDGLTLVAGGQDGVLRLWNATTGVKVTEFAANK
jgi:WD40 repeat protein